MLIFSVLFCFVCFKANFKIDPISSNKNTIDYLSKEARVTHFILINVG